MCGRWATPYSRDDIERRYKVRAPEFKPSYNIAPGSMETVIVRDGSNRAEVMKWGLIPFWAKDPRIGYKMINARAESVAEKPSFRKSFASRRCLIPAGGFYEWRHDEKRRIPYYIRLKSSPIFSIAGLYDLWKSPEGKEVKTFTIITTSPNSVMSPIHDRMPVIVAPEREDDWLKDTPSDELMRLLTPYKHEGDMEAYPISTKVNDPSYNNEDVLNPASTQ